MGRASRQSGSEMKRDFSVEPNTRGNLVVIGFHHVADANEMGAALVRLQDEFVIGADDMMVVTRPIIALTIPTSL